MPGVLGPELHPLREPGYDAILANGTPGLGVWSLEDPPHPARIASISAATIGTFTGET